MALPNPREMPEPHRLLPVDFKPIPMQIVHHHRNGLADVASIGPTLWGADLRTAPLSEAEAGVWKSVLASLRGGQFSLKIWPPMRRFPLAYQSGWGVLQKAGGGAFTGLAALDGVGTNNDAVTISDLPAAFNLQPGDFIAFDYDGGRRALHQVVENAVANGSGIGTWTVEPFVRPGWVATTPVDLEKPYCLMLVDPESVSTQPGVNRATAVSFSAFQTLERP